MSTSSRRRVRDGLTLEEFLRMPGIDERPYLEFIDGRIEGKAVPRARHSMIETRIAESLNRVAGPLDQGFAFVELRCTFAGRSIVPDVVYLRREHIEVDESGELLDEVRRPPDIQVEIISPKQGVSKAHEKLLHAAAHGCPLGVLIHPEHRTIDVYRPGRPPERLAPDGGIEGEPVLPGLRLPAAEVFGWLRYGRPGAGAE